MDPLPIVNYIHQLVSLLTVALRWRHNGRDGVSNHQPHDCLFNRLFRRSSKKTSKLRVTGLCAGNSPVFGEFPVQMASNAENVSIWWRYHGTRHVTETCCKFVINYYIYEHDITMYITSPIFSDFI